MSKPIQVGDKYRMWFGESTVLAVLPYAGSYPQFFAKVLRVSTSTPKGWTEVAVA